MKILIKSEGVRMTVRIPTAMVFSRPTAWIIAKSAGKLSVKYIAENVRDRTAGALTNLPEKSVKLLFDEIRKIKRKYGSWDLAEVESADGDHILIRL